MTNLKTCKITDEELAVIAETRNKDCAEGHHLKLSSGRDAKLLPNGRSYVYCANCLWAELEPCDDDLKIGKLQTFPGTTLRGF
jgi:hypothetical protein